MRQIENIDLSDMAEFKRFLRLLADEIMNLLTQAKKRSI